MKMKIEHNFLSFDDSCMLELMEKPTVGGQKETASEVEGLAHLWKQPLY